MENQLTTTNQLAVVTQLPIIQERLRDAKAGIEARTQQAQSLICTTESLKAVKETRADLSKVFASLEEQRKAVKAQVLAPYEEFERVYKECVTVPFKEADAALKAKISEVEDGLKREKESKIIAFFNEYKAAKHVEFLRFEDTKIRVGLSGSLKSLKEQSAAFIDKVASDIQFIQTTQPADCNEMIFEYKSSLSVTHAVDIVLRRKHALEEQRRQREEQKAARAAAQAAAEKVEQAVQEQMPPPVAPPEERPVEEKQIVPPAPSNGKKYIVGFKVIGSIDQIKKLKAFLVEGGYQYEQF